MLKIIKKVYIVLIYMLIIVLLYPQTEPPEDEHENDVVQDSIPQMDGPVVFDSLHYSADSLSYYVDTEQIELTGNAEIKYGSATIKADSINVNFTNDQAQAYGDIIMEDGDQIILGSSVYYDINTETGMIFSGASRFEQGYYYGHEIRKVGTEVFDLDDGKFTTCEAYHPHFDFRATSMRVYRNHMVVCKPLFLYVNEFPILAFPFASISIKRGRQSGFLIPEPGYNAHDGKYLQNIAYFWAFNDYSDMTIGMDLLEKTGRSFNLDLVYLNRISNYDGRLHGNYHHKILTPDSYRNDWYFYYRHYHKLPESAVFNVNLDFASSRQVWETDTDVNKKFQESITSSISYQKRYANNNAFNASSSYRENLLLKDKRIILPRVHYNLSSRQIQEFISVIPDSVRKQDHWWKSFSFGGAITGLHVGNIKDKTPTMSQIFYQNEKDDSGRYISEHRAGIRQSATFSWVPSLFGWLKINNTLNYINALSDRDKNDNKFAYGYSYNSSHRASFSLTGIRRFQNFPIIAAKHDVNPSVIFSYSPDFSQKNKDFYGFEDINVSMSKKQRIVAPSLNQSWSFRLQDGENNRGKYLNSLLMHNVNTMYDLEKKEKQWSDVTQNATINPGSYNFFKINFSVSQYYSSTHDPYNDLNLKSWAVRSSLNVSGNAVYHDYFPYQVNDFVSGNFFPADSLKIVENQIRTIGDLEKLEKSGNWSLTIGHDYSYNKSPKFKTHNITNTLAMKITENWSVSYDQYYNLKINKLNRQSIMLNRDIHCWRMTMNYTMLTNFWDYRIVFFNTRLPDSLKLHNRGYSTW